MLDESRLKTVIAAILELEPGDITEDSSSDTIEQWDSLRHMNLVLALEDEFGVSIPDGEAADITSYKLIRLVLAGLLKDGA
jgi:acyl carrier protein